MTDDPFEEHRDEQGRFVKGKPGWTSEQAREYGARGGAARSKTKAQMLDDTDALLFEAGFDPSTAPTHLRLLSENAVRGKVEAIRQFIRLTRQDTPETSAAPPPPEPGARCPTCQHWNLSLDLDLARDIDDQDYKLLVALAHAFMEYLNARISDKPSWADVSEQPPNTPPTPHISTERAERLEVANPID